MTSREDLERTAREFFQHIWNDGDESAIDRFIAEDAAGNDPQFGIGREDFRRQWRQWRFAFPDIHFSVEEVIADPHTGAVATRWILTGTHSAEFWGAPATGAKVSVPGVSIDRIADGMVISGFDAWDTVVLRRQIGLLPDPAKQQ
jgi:steroid delta-isomerase-like uncharacterized protein